MFLHWLSGKLPRWGQQVSRKC